MRALLTIVVLLSLTGVIGGCAGHYYRTDASGTIFYLRLPEAASVVLYTSVDGFKPHTAERRSGRWSNTLSATGEFVYFYRVDGEVFIPDCRFREKDDFGRENCIFLPTR
jgi:zinc transporter ZupT